ncbi:MAG: hypothetical protein ACOYOL_04665 [Chthoniobacterales bacterium]
MKSLRHIFPMIASAVALLATNSEGWAAEQPKIPLFHRVLVVNHTARPLVADGPSGLITAILEIRQEDGRWRAVGKLRAPTRACAIPELSEDEVWQFIIPDLGTGVPATARLAVGISGETIHSRPFAAHVDPLTSDTNLDCWLARIRPAQPNQGPIIAVAESKPGN